MVLPPITAAVLHEVDTAAASSGGPTVTELLRSSSITRRSFVEDACLPLTTSLLSLALNPDAASPNQFAGAACPAFNVRRALLRCTLAGA